MRVRAPSVSCCRGNATPAQLHHSATQFYIICIVVHPRHLHDMMSLRVHSIISDDATQGTLQHHPTEWFDWHIYTCAGRSALLWMMHPLISPRRRPHFELNSCFEKKKESRHGTITYRGVILQHLRVWRFGIECASDRLRPSSVNVCATPSLLSFFFSFCHVILSFKLG